MCRIRLELIKMEHLNQKVSTYQLINLVEGKEVILVLISRRSFTRSFWANPKEVILHRVHVSPIYSFRTLVEIKGSDLLKIKWNKIWLQSRVGDVCHHLVRARAAKMNTSMKYGLFLNNHKMKGTLHKGCPHKWKHLTHLRWK